MIKKTSDARNRGCRWTPVPFAMACLCVLAGLDSSAYAAPEPSPALAAVLERVKFNGAEKAEDLGKALAALPADDLVTLCDLLVEPGTGDDTKPRMALEGLTWYVDCHAIADERARYVHVLCAALESDQPAAVKSFLIQQLQLIGDEHAIPALAKLLHNDDLYDFAAQALLAIGGDTAAAAFRTAYAGATEAQRIAITEALGALHDGRAAELLLPVAAAPEDSPERRAARAALADIGANPTFNPPKATDARYDQSQEWAIFFRLIDGSRAKGAAADITRALGVMLKSHATHSASGQTALLYELARTAGAQAVPNVVAAMAGEDRELAAGATEIAVTIDGSQATDAFVGELKRATPGVRAALLRVLARRADVAALPVVLEAVKDEDKAVRLAAIPAAAVLGKEDAIKPLVAALDTDQDDEREAVRQALWRIPGPTSAARIAGALDGAPPRVRIALLQALTDRRAKDQLDAVYTNATNTDEAVRIAAIQAVGVLADQAAATKLLPLLSQAKSDAERTALEDALAAACNRAATVALRSFPILAALHPDSPADYASLLRVLGHIGGSDALNAVRTGLADQRDDVRAAAFQALLDWPDPAAAEDVLKIAKETKELKNYVLALRAYVRLVALDKQRPAKDAVALYQAGLDLARRPDEKKLIFAKLGEIHDALALAALEPYLADEALQAEAATAAISVADGLLPGGWATARPALEKVLALHVADAVRERAEQAMKRVAEFEDFVTDWEVAGPYTQAGKRGDQLFDVAFPPEEKDAPAVKWLKQPVTADPARYWFIDLQATPSIAGDNRAAYLRTRVHSPDAREALFEFGSDDGIKVWLNGEVIDAQNVPRGCQRAQDKVKANLKAGWNDLLLKVVNGGGAWGACVRIRTPEGGHLDGLRVAASRDQ